ncbi:MAG: hypothetical protein PHS82_04015 [Lachnospiraceae bacterium]|nr:hypothetical protein [Lachnospiraceae bacterium]
MKARTCRLCGGKVRNGRCMDCGMDNSRSDDDIHANMNDDTRGAIPRMTAQDMVRQAMVRDKHIEADIRTKARQESHANEQRTNTQPQGQYNQAKGRYTTSQSQHTQQTGQHVPPRTKAYYRKSNQGLSWIVFVIIALVLLGNVSSGFFDHETETSVEPVQNIMILEASEDTEDPEYVYEVGADLQAGNYDLQYVSGDEISVEVERDNDVTMYYLSEDQSFIEGVQLQEGDMVISYYGEAGISPSSY